MYTQLSISGIPTVTSMKDGGRQAIAMAMEGLKRGGRTRDPYTSEAGRMTRSWDMEYWKTKSSKGLAYQYEEYYPPIEVRSWPYSLNSQFP